MVQFSALFVVYVKPNKLKYKGLIDLISISYFKQKTYTSLIRKTQTYDYSFDSIQSLLAKYSLNLSMARNRCDIVFFSVLSISPQVCAQPVGWKQGSHPKARLPRGATISPAVLPWNSNTFLPGPSLKAYVHTASADLSSKPMSILWRPSGCKLSRNHLMYGPVFFLFKFNKQVNFFYNRQILLQCLIK